MSFERSWDEYVEGFGDVDSNFWLGLEDIHYLTTECTMRLQIDVVPFNIPAVSIPYPQFQVGDATSDYLLTVTSDIPGHESLNNSFTRSSGMRFTTYDRDNDLSAANNCAVDYKAGWWFNNCYKLNLNGVYGGASEITGTNMRMLYLSNDNNEPIRTVTMTIRPTD